jgi:putative transposase
MCLHGEYGIGSHDRGLGAADEGYQVGAGTGRVQTQRFHGRLVVWRETFGQRPTGTFRPEGGQFANYTASMPSSWTQNYYHAIFSTRHRAEVLTPEIEERLYPFIGGILRDLDASLLAINGMPDHVHLLVRYPGDLSHADMMRHVKSRSSKWMHESLPAGRDVHWQSGYGGFTVSKSMTQAVEAYIAGQKEHHRRQNFIEEVRALCRLNGVDLDEVHAFE